VIGEPLYTHRFGGRARSRARRGVAPQPQDLIGGERVGAGAQQLRPLEEAGVSELAQHRRSLLGRQPHTAALDAYVADYNTDRPHRALEAKLPVTLGERFCPVPEQQRAAVDLWLPPSLLSAP
jgi:hypothetical protein